MNCREQIPMCPTILPADRATKLHADSPDEPFGPSKYFHRRTSWEKHVEFAGKSNPLMRNWLNSGISVRLNGMICLPEVIPMFRQEGHLGKSPLFSQLRYRRLKVECQSKCQ